MLPETTNALEPNLPITTLSSLNTSNIGRPVMSLTFIKLPLRLSVMPNNVPALPINDTLPSCNTSNLMDEVELPENTIVAFAVELGDFNIIYDDVTVPKVTLLAVVNANP